MACVRHLLRRGVEVDAALFHGGTALLAAAEGGHVEVLHLLIDRGADVQKRRSDGSSALHCAAAKGCLECVTALVNAGKHRNTMC